MPPFVGVDPTASVAMSPYLSTCDDVASRYATSSERIKILGGLFDYRDLLLSNQIQGFQWLAGSFVDDIEAIDKRPPNDVDVVTFLWRPAALKSHADWQAFAAANIALFSNVPIKSKYFCDCYFVDLDSGDVKSVVDQTRFWFGLFTHRRITSVWKGIIHIPLLSPSDHANARQILSAKSGNP